MKKKILFNYLGTLEFFVEKGKPIGGSAVETLVWMKIFKELEYEVQQIIFERDSRPKKEEFNWIKFITIFDPRKTMIRMWYFYRLPIFFKSLKYSKCDYLFTSIPAWYSFYHSIFCIALGIKHIIRIPSDKTVDDKIYLTESRLNSFYIKMSLKFSHIILAQNSYQYAQLIKKYPKKKIVKIFNPFIINEKYLTAKNRFNGFIAWVANFRHVKNLALLYKIAKQYPNELFKVAGIPLLPLDEETDKSVKALEKLENVEFVGTIPRDEILTFFHGAKYLLNTSRYEGFSNTFIEAMATGTPILTTVNVNPDNIINDFKLGGIFTSEFDIGCFFDNNISNEYLKWSSNCIEFIKKYHDHRQIANSIRKVLEKV